MMDPQAILTLVLGAGGTGFVGLVWRMFQDRKKGKLESEDTLISRMNAQSAKDTARAEAAEKKADQADTRVDEMVSKMTDLRMQMAFYMAFIVSNNLRVPKWPPDDEEVKP
jgi:hypothetical protein